jgi:ribonuclease PH
MTFTLPANADISAKTLALAATASSGASVIYSTTSTDTCSVTGSTLNLLKAGNCVVTASQGGTPTIAPVSTTATIMLTGAVIAPTPTVTKKTIVCTKGKINKKVSGTSPKCPKGYKVKK